MHSYNPRSSSMIRMSLKTKHYKSSNRIKFKRTTQPDKYKYIQTCILIVFSSANKQTKMQFQVCICLSLILSCSIQLACLIFRCLSTFEPSDFIRAVYEWLLINTFYKYFWSIFRTGESSCTFRRIVWIFLITTLLTITFQYSLIIILMVILCLSISRLPNPSVLDLPGQTATIDSSYRQFAVI